MPPKRPAPAKASSGKPKRKRKMMTICEKVTLLDLLKEGRSYAAVARHYGVNESTVRSIKKDEPKIRKTALITVNKEAKRLVSRRNQRIMKMEPALATWIAECRKDNVSLDTNMIRAKAIALYDKFGSDGDADDGHKEQDRGFVASKGWFDKFQKRFSLRSMPLYCEAAPADTPAACRYVEEEFLELIAEGGYLPEQVFNADETALFWKTFPLEDEVKRPGFKAHEERVTLVMCGNAAGFMLKPGLIYKCETPRALKNKDKALLPVYWMHNSGACITKALTRDWFLHCFIPQVKSYLAEKGVPFKVLLLMDCAAGHATDLQHDGVQVEFLPADAAPLLQPMEQGVTRAFKALYTRSATEGLVSALDEDGVTPENYWRGYSIATCLRNIQQALRDLKCETLNWSWKKLWPQVVDPHAGFTPDQVRQWAVEKTVRLARLVHRPGFADMTPEDVNGLIDCHPEPLPDRDLVEAAESPGQEEEDEPDRDEETEERGLTLEGLRELCDIARRLQRRAQEMDHNMVRAVEFGERVDGVMSLYKSILAQKKKQRQNTAEASTPPARPSSPPSEAAFYELAPLSDDDFEE